jgi:serine/threonine protein phosphatase PrpC
MSARNSLKRRGPARKHQITLGAHAPEITDMHSVNMHRSGKAGDLFFVIFKGMGGNQVSSG